MKRLILDRQLLAAVTGIFLLVACSGDQSEVQRERPAYAAADYASVETSAETTALHFTDITRQAGITFEHETGAFGQKWMPETMGSGGGFIDFDNDGLPDIFLVNSKEWSGFETKKQISPPALYKNLGNGQFIDVTRDAGLWFELYGMGCTFGDFDGDGDLDIYITAVGDNKLLRNDNGVFVDVTRQMRVAGNSPDPGVPPAWSTSAAWVDIDRDGWLDLFVCSYVKWTPETDIFTTLDGKNKSYATPEQYRGETSRLYRNVGGRYFEDITEQAGILNDEGKSLGVAIHDFNNDGWPDIVVANDTQPNFLYLNNGDGTFTDVALRAGIAFDEAGRARAGMGIDIADIFSRGELSIAIGNFSREPVSLYTQIGDQLFQDRAGTARITRPSLLSLTFGLLFFDADLDGHLDLILGNGHIEPEINSVQQDITFKQAPQLFRNTSGGQFVDISSQVGADFSQPIVARGIAVADIDGDGDLDLLVTINGGAPKLLRNDLPADSSNWIKFRLRGNPPNIFAVGARISVWLDGQQRSQMIRTGSSYLSQSDISTVVFGLGEATSVDSVEVRWPGSGESNGFGPAAGRKTYTIREAAPSLSQAK